VHDLKIKADRMTHKAASIIFGVFVGTLGLMGTSVLFYGRRLKGNLIKLTDAAERISVGELNTDINIQSNDEISDLAETIGRMQESIRLSIERLRKRR
jgi:HAMP domain-containing protein